MPSQSSGGGLTRLLLMPTALLLPRTRSLSRRMEFYCAVRPPSVTTAMRPVRDRHMEISARVTSGAVHVRTAQPTMPQRTGTSFSTLTSGLGGVPAGPGGRLRSCASVRRRGLSGRCSSTCPLYRQVAALRLVKLCCCRRRPKIRRSDGNRLLQRSATVHHRGSAAPQRWSTGDDVPRAP